LSDVLARRSGRSVLHVVPTGDHSLLATKTHLSKAGVSQDDLDHAAQGAIDAFCRSL
jgi:hypothetical protein